MDVSVIIPCYNAQATLAEQLEALAAQEFSGSWEVILADNRSTDHSVAIAQQFADRLPSLRIVSAAARQGPAHAMNAGASAAQGRLLTFVDADDVVAPGWLAAIVHALGTYDFVASRHDFTRLNTPEVVGERENRQSEGLQPYTYPPYLPHAGGCGLGIRREHHEAVGGFDEDFFQLQDTDYCWRVQLMGISLTFVPDALIYVRYREQLIDSYRQAKGYAEYNVLLYKRYLPRGMPRLTFRSSLLSWYYFLLRTPQLLNPTTRKVWIRQLGWRMGRLIGSIKYRVLAL